MFGTYNTIGLDKETLTYNIDFNFSKAFMMQNYR